MLKIAPGVNWYDREDWGARTDIPRLGELLNPLEATEAIMHHTVVIDNDATPNIWEDLPECFVKMRQLQTIRPDLGLDVPYNAVAFMLQYTNGTRELALMGGRGFDRRGAHTSYHNRTGRAIALEGNLELFVDVHPYVQMFSWAWGWAKERYGLANLGSVHPTGRAIFGHKNFAQTACPGQSLMAVIDSIKIEAYQPPQEEEMFRLIRSPGGFVYVQSGGIKQYVPDMALVQPLIAAGELSPTIVTKDSWYVLALSLGPEAGKPFPATAGGHTQHTVTVTAS